MTILGGFGQLDQILSLVQGQFAQPPRVLTESYSRISGMLLGVLLTLLFICDEVVVVLEQLQLLEFRC